MKGNSKTWFFIASYIAVIYLTLPVMRHLLGFFYNLVGRPAVRHSITVLIAGFALYVFSVLSRRVSAFRAVLPVALLCILAAYVKTPEERIHFIEYGVLGFLVLKTGRGVFFALLFSAVVGGVDELIQHFLPNRVGDMRDVLMNAAGGALGVWAGRLYLVRRSPSQVDYKPL